LARIVVPSDLDEVLDTAWEAARKIPGFLVENEARFLGTIAACTPCKGSIVEIGSFKGKSTVMLAKVCKHYGLGPVVAIDPHNFSSSVEVQKYKTAPEMESYQEFQENIKVAGVSDYVLPHRAYSSEISPTWNSPIRFLWIDGDHSYQGAKADFDGFSGFLEPQGVVAFHDALHEFSGPIRVFAEDVLSSRLFGISGFVHSIAWSQFRPEDGNRFEDQRISLQRLANRLIPFVKDDVELSGLRRLLYKLNRSRIPRSALQPREWISLLKSE